MTTLSAPARMEAEALYAIATGLAQVAGSWSDRAPADEGARTGVRLLASEHFDVWALRWPPHTSVTPHDHGESAGAFVVAQGRISEIRWREERPVGTVLAAGEGVTFGRGEVHDVVAGPEGALSVHVYSPPLSRMAFFDDRAESVIYEEEVDLTYDGFGPADGVVAEEVSGGGAGEPGDLPGEGGVERRLRDARSRIAPRARPEELAAEMAGGALVVDTRPHEQRRRDGEIEGSVIVERNVLEWRLAPTSPHRIDGVADPNRRVIVVCDEGYASSLAAASLLDVGRRNVTDLEGGFQAWRRLREG